MYSDTSIKDQYFFVSTYALVFYALFSFKRNKVNGPETAV